MVCLTQDPSSARHAATADQSDFKFSAAAPVAYKIQDYCSYSFKLYGRNH